MHPGELLSLILLDHVHSLRYKKPPQALILVYCPMMQIGHAQRLTHIEYCSHLPLFPSATRTLLLYSCLTFAATACTPFVGAAGVPSL
jgi:hypothetical protein